MIYDENPEDQLNQCLDVLTTLTYALDFCDNKSFASTCLTVEWGIKDAIARIKANHKAERERFTEAALHVSLSKMGTDYLSIGTREVDRAP